MKFKRTGIMIATIVLIITLYSGVSLADKSAVTIDAPDQAVKGTEMTVKIHVTHSSNSFLHYTNRLAVIVNGKEAALWEYSMGNKPENAKFSKEIRLTVNGPTEIVAEATCNLHGSQGPAKKAISLKE